MVETTPIQHGTRTMNQAAHAPTGSVSRAHPGYASHRDAVALHRGFRHGRLPFIPRSKSSRRFRRSRTHGRNTSPSCEFSPPCRSGLWFRMTSTRWACSLSRHTRRTASSNRSESCRGDRSLRNSCRPPALHARQGRCLGTDRGERRGRPVSGGPERFASDPHAARQQTRPPALLRSPACSIGRIHS